MRLAVAGLTSLAFSFTAVAATLVVSNAGDIVNGDVRSAAALIAAPGPDGISLREALAAANAQGGPHEITFASSLEGTAIFLGAPLQVTRSGITIRGFAGADGRPAVTIDASRMVHGRFPYQGVIYITASRVMLTGLRLAGATNNFVEVIAGSVWAPNDPGWWTHAPNTVTDVRIEDNLFDNAAYDEVPFLTAVRVWMLHEERRARISRVSIARNTVVGYTRTNDAGFIVSPSGVEGIIEDVVIDENRFETTFPLELSYISGERCTIRNVRITRNQLLGATVSLLIGNLGSRNRVHDGNVIEGTLVESNVMRSHFGGVGVTNFSVDPDVTVRNCVVRDTTFRNNVMATGEGIRLIGGQLGTAGNSIEDVKIINNTIVTSPLAGVLALSNANGGAGNRVTGVVIRNTLFDGPVRNQTGPEDEVEGELASEDVTHSLIQTDRFAGRNGNITGDPRFVDAAAGNFHLRAGSAAIGRADPATAPEADLDCNGRTHPPDIGAYEFNGTIRPRLTVVEQWPTTAGIEISPPGSPCGAATWTFAPGTVVRLTPRMSSFSHWSGDGDCEDGLVTMDRDVTCIANAITQTRRRAVRH